jgi:predicted transcriptional regulator
MNFKQAALISNFISKDYAEKIFKLIVTYKDISASEAASRLDMHIRTVQDFLDTMTTFDIVEKFEVFEKKRPYFRYALKKKKIEIIIDLDKEFSEEKEHSSELKIKELKNSGAKFSVARNGDYFSAVTLWIGKGRNLKERKINLTNSQGQFLYFLPFPDAEPLTVSEIMSKGNIEDVHKGEINNIISELINLKVIDKFYE